LNAIGNQISHYRIKICVKFNQSYHQETNIFYMICHVANFLWA